MPGRLGALAYLFGVLLRRAANADDVRILVAVAVCHAHLSVDAMWTPDAEQAKDPKGIDIIDRANESVEMIASIERRYKSDGYSEGGWFIRASGYGWDYAAPNKREAMKALRAAVAGYFNR